jgi:hypothetical protein
MTRVPPNLVPAKGFSKPYSPHVTEYTRAWANNREPLRGLTRSQWQGRLEQHNNALDRHGEKYVLKVAEGIGGIPNTKPYWLSYSLFGWHANDLLQLRKMPELAGPLAAPRIACYGAGLHSDFSHLSADWQEFDPAVFYQNQVALERLRIAEASCLGTTGCFEPKELLALLLGGDRPGSLHVFEPYAAVEASLVNPGFSFINAVEAFYFMIPADERATYC